MDAGVIATERKARGWSQAELARRARMHPSTVSLVESGRLKPGETQLAKLEAALLEDVGHDAGN